MPELPEVAAIADYVDEHAAGFPIRRVDVASLSVLKTADPPYTALIGRIVDLSLIHISEPTRPY